VFRFCGRQSIDRRLNYDAVGDLFVRLSAEAVLESFHCDDDRRFAVNSVGGATHRSELATAKPVGQINLTSSYVELKAMLSQIAPHTDVYRLAVVVNALICTILNI